MDNNNEQIANIMENWIQNNVTGPQGQYKP
jgi:hypothetical protein